MKKVTFESIPGAKLFWRIYQKSRFKKSNTENVFSEIYQKNSWGDKESVSGTGSNLNQAEVLIKELPGLIKDLKVLSVLDIPCGDFNWMRKIDLNNVNYIGADIVKDIVLKNTEKYEKKNISFLHLDLIKDDLPRVDIVICRDCLVHFSFDDIFLALKNVCRSKSKYFLTTTFIDCKKNHDIFTGQWRTLNLTLSPFNLSQPIKIIKEECTEDNGVFADKAICLWKVDDIIKCIKNY